jgi:1H-pyrrole-2-carbonyl-[peptidyl-carrier protein] chlorinase
MPDIDFEVGIIGGGPGGSAMGAYLAKAGLSCVILEKDIFPREHVGESLVPSSTRVFKELDLLSHMEEHKFPRKYGAVWTAAKSPLTYEVNWDGLSPDTFAAIRFDERAQPGVDKNYTYHVDRGKFDQMLLQHAHRLGARVYEGIRVKRVDFSAGDGVEIRFDLGRHEAAVRVGMVVDASGRQTFLGNQEMLKVPDPLFDQFAIHTWFEGFDRRTQSKTDEQADYIHIHFLPVSNSWMWQIPITDRITSVGAVTQRKNFGKTRMSREQWFWSCVATRPDLAEALGHARQLRQLKEEGDYSYSMKQICGDRFLMIGDAARFVDPIFSTGVSIALNSARFASRDIIAAAAAGDYQKASFHNFETTIRRGVKNWYDFINLYYRLNVLFTWFILEPEYRLDVLQLLQGDVYDEDQPRVLEKMREMVSQVERNPHHPWHRLLNDLTAKAFTPNAVAQSPEFLGRGVE